SPSPSRAQNAFSGKYIPCSGGVSTPRHHEHIGTTPAPTPLSTHTPQSTREATTRLPPIPRHPRVADLRGLPLLGTDGLDRHLGDEPVGLAGGDGVAQPGDERRQLIARGNDRGLTLLELERRLTHADRHVGPAAVVLAPPGFDAGLLLHATTGIALAGPAVLHPDVVGVS